MMVCFCAISEQLTAVNLLMKSESASETGCLMKMVINAACFIPCSGLLLHTMCRCFHSRSLPAVWLTLQEETYFSSPQICLQYIHSCYSVYMATTGQIRVTLQASVQVTGNWAHAHKRTRTHAHTQWSVLTKSQPLPGWQELGVLYPWAKARDKTWRRWEGEHEAKCVWHTSVCVWHRISVVGVPQQAASENQSS